MDWLNKPWFNHIIGKHGAVEKNEIDPNVPNVLIQNNLKIQRSVWYVPECATKGKDKRRYTHYFHKDT